MHLLQFVSFFGYCSLLPLDCSSKSIGIIATLFITAFVLHNIEQNFDKYLLIEFLNDPWALLEFRIQRTYLMGYRGCMLTVLPECMHKGGVVSAKVTMGTSRRGEDREDAWCCFRLCFAFLAWGLGSESKRKVCRQRVGVLFKLRSMGQVTKSHKLGELPVSSESSVEL
jgi:hypothetical protein